MDKPPLTLADLSPQVRLHLPTWIDADYFDGAGYVSARIVHGVAILKEPDGDLTRYYLGYEIDHDASVSSGYCGRWVVGTRAPSAAQRRLHVGSTLEGCKRYGDQGIAAKAGGAS
jgi:hypothetical protein